MKLAVVGNNDGPLRILKSLSFLYKSPAFLGLQKPVSKALNSEYKNIYKNEIYSIPDESELIEKLEGKGIDIIINCFCNYIFKKTLEKYTVLNVHPSPLPKYRGRHPMHWGLINGETEFGITIHKMVKKVDAGEILWQEKVPISDGMSVQELRTKLMDKLETDFGQFWLDYAAGKIEAQANPEDAATHAPRRYPEDSRLTEWHDSELIFRKVMALRSEGNPAFIEILNKKITFAKAERAGRGKASFKPYFRKIENQELEAVATDGGILRLTTFENLPNDLKTSFL